MVLHVDFEASWPVLQSKFTVLDSGKYQNERLLFEKQRRQKYSKSRRENATTKKGEVDEKDIYIKFDHLSLTKVEYFKIEALGYNKVQIDEVLEKIKNYRKNTNYKSLYTTAKNWLKTEHGTPLQKGDGGNKRKALA